MQKIKIVNHKSLIRRSGFAITSKILQGFKIRGKKYQRNQRNLSALICEKKNRLYKYTSRHYGYAIHNAIIKGFLITKKIK